MRAVSAITIHACRFSLSARLATSALENVEYNVDSSETVDKSAMPTLCAVNAQCQVQVGDEPPQDAARRDHVQHQRRRERQPPRLGLLTEVPPDTQDVQEVADGRDDGAGEWTWVAMTSLLDSGAARSVCPSHFCGHLPAQESAESRRGQLFRTAGGELIQNRGERVVRGYTQDYLPVGMKYAVTDVQVPLDSISQMCEGGRGGQCRRRRRLS